MPEAGSAPRLLYVVTEDWFFVSHFLPMARAAQALGYEVCVATRVDAHGAAIKAAGLRLIPLAFDRSGNGPARLAGQIAQLAEIMEAERPEIVHCIALRSIIVGGFAARRAGIARVVLAVTGLGHLWTSRRPGARIGRLIVRRWLRRLRRPGTVFLFENHDDPGALGLQTSGAGIAFMPGAGVDPEAFVAQLQPPEREPIRAAMVSRMLWAKGVDTAVEAVAVLRREGVPIELHIWGSPDRANPEAIPERQLNAWNDLPGISWHGRGNDIRDVWRDSHFAVAPSRYREGAPRAIIEAMASARAVVTTDVPGCRELIRDGEQGLLVPKDDGVALAAAMRRLAEDPDLRVRLGSAARARFEAGYTTAHVMERITAVYRDLRPG